VEHLIWRWTTGFVIRLSDFQEARDFQSSLMTLLLFTMGGQRKEVVMGIEIEVRHCSVVVWAWSAPLLEHETWQVLLDDWQRKAQQVAELWGNPTATVVGWCGLDKCVLILSRTTVGIFQNQG
jgi:hypothetical protein